MEQRKRWLLPLVLFLAAGSLVSTWIGTAPAVETLPGTVITDTLYVYEECYVDSVEKNATHDTTFVCVDYTATQHKKALLKWNLDPVPVNHAILSATVVLTADSTTTAPAPTQLIAVYRCLQFWEETTTTWSEFDTVYTYMKPTGWALAVDGNYYAIGASFPMPASANMVTDDVVKNTTQLSVDITTLVRQWKNSTYENHGVILDYPRRLASSSALRFRAQYAV